MLNQIEINQLAKARNGDQHQFSMLIEPYRAELQVHCYRMLGSLEDAEDLVQETFLRAWRSLDIFVKNVSFRAWLYKIATNACLDAIDKRSRRTLPTMTHAPSNPHLPHTPETDEYLWLEPYPDAALSGVGVNPEARYSLHESVRLAFMVALQSLPPRQRAVLLLRDVLDWRAKEVAEHLEMTSSAVNSALHRARKTLRQNYQQSNKEIVIDRGTDQSTQMALDRYVQAWETADIYTLVSLLKEDATFVMPPSPSWYQGYEAIQAFLSETLFSPQPKQRWRLLPSRSNGQHAFGLYEFDSDRNTFRAAAIQVLAFQNSQISNVVTFVKSTLFSYFELPHEVGA
jgi:RNA polymerase sigma-70 factor (ECF subfamily)